MSAVALTVYEWRSHRFLQRINGIARVQNYLKKNLHIYPMHYYITYIIIYLYSPEI